MGGRSAVELDSTEVAGLEALIVDHHDRPAIWISNLLCAVYGKCRPPLTGGDGEPKRRRRPVLPPNERLSDGRLLIIPNPASTSTSFAYTLQGAPEDAWLAVHDLTGRSIYLVRLAQREGVLIWGIQSLAAGVYNVTVTESGIPVRTEKLILQP